MTGAAPDVVIPADMKLGEVRDATDAREKARYLFQHGADFIKLIATGAVPALGSEPGQLELSFDEKKAACDEAKAHGSYCIAHAHGTEGIKVAIRAGVRSISHASLIDDEGIAMAKAGGVWLDMDIYDGDWINDEGVNDGWPAEYLRKNRDTTDGGSASPGHYGDLIAVAGDPLRDISVLTHVEGVIKGGELVKAAP